MRTASGATHKATPLPDVGEVMAYITKGIGGFYYVKTPDGIVECKARGIFRKRGITPVAGDNVTLSDDGTMIDEILPRKNVFIRPPIANLDILFIVTSTTQPVPSTLVLDQLAAAAIYKDVQPVLVVTKSDLAAADMLRTAYAGSGIPLVQLNYETGEGLDEVKGYIEGHLCAFCGNSGVGKSTLLNTLAPALHRETGQISQKLGRGRHTTREVTIFEAFDGRIADTPGFASLEANRAGFIPKENLAGSSVECVQNDNAFRVCFSDPDQGKKSAQYIGEHKLATKVAVIYDSSDTYSTGIYESFKSEAVNQGIEVVAEGAFTADNKTDFSVPLQQAQAAGAELVFLPIYYTEASLIITQANKMGYAPQFFGCDGLDGLIGVENFDQSLAEGVMLLTPFAADAQDDLTQKFVSAYKDKYGETPIQFAADAYDAIYAIKLAAEKENVTPDMSVSDICEAMKKGMTEITLEGLTGTITWTASGEPDKEPKAVKIENGAYTAME